MPNTFHALKSRRVEEALDSVRRHVRIAIQQTRMDSVGTSIQTLSKVPLPSLAEVTKVRPATIPYEDRDTNSDITLTGANLDEVHAIHLIGSGEVKPWSTLADTIEPSPDGKSLKARFPDLGSAPPGPYNLLLIDNALQTTLASNVLTIDPPAEAEKVSRQEGLQLGAMFPNGSIQGTTLPAVVVVLKGKPTEFCVTDMEGNEQSDWTVEMVQRDEWGNRYGWKASQVNAHLAEVQKLFSRKVELVLLVMGIPNGVVKGGEVRQIFRVVGKSSRPAGEDALAFFVRRELKQTY